MKRLSQTWRQKQRTSNTAVEVKNTSPTSEIVEGGTPRRSQRLANSRTVGTPEDNCGNNVLQDITRLQDKNTASGKKKNSPSSNTSNSSGQCSLFSTSFGFEFDVDVLSAVDKMEKDHLCVKNKSPHVPGLSPIIPFSPKGFSSPVSPTHSNVKTMRSTPKDEPGNENACPEVVDNQGPVGQSCTNGEPEGAKTCQVSKEMPLVQSVAEPIHVSGGVSENTRVLEKNNVKSWDNIRNSFSNPGKSDQNPVEPKPRSSQTISPERCQLSSWGLPDIILEQYEKIGIKTMFEWQADCLCTGNVLNGGNLVYSAPTSAGKTMVAEILMLKRILETKCKALFILPFVSVAREKMFYLQRMFQEAGIKVDGYMGSQAPTKGFNSLDIAVCTIEKANGLVNRLMEDGQLHTVGAIVVDEMHLIGDSSRGYLLELLLTKVLYMRDGSVATDCAAKGNVQIIGMSATLPNVDVLAKWLRADLFFTNFRPVPLTETLKVGPIIYDSEGKKIRELSQSRMVSGDDDHVSLLCQETVEEGHAVLMFCPTKSWCEKLAESVARHFFNLGRGKVDGGREKSKARFVKASSLVMFDYDGIQDVFEQLKSCHVGLDSVLGKTLRYGVAYHHAGLTFDERDIIEGAFRQGIIKVLIATSTLSSGVNLPARRVIIRTPIFYGKLMDGLVYKQMSGRAGRKGVDSQGESILICKPAERQKASCLLHDDLKPIESCLVVKRSDEDEGNGVRRALLEVIASGVATTPADVQRYASCTFYVSSKAQEIDGRSTESIIESTVHYLARNEFITLSKKEEVKDQENSTSERFVPTQLGQATLASSLSPDEALVVFADLRKARKCFVLENELHIIYQVTPIYLQDQWPNLEWYQYLKIWEHLPSHMKRVAELVGIEERFLTRAIRGRVPMRTEAQRRTVGIHKRFYVSLALHDLVHEVPLDVVARKFGASRGMLQSLQSSAATFAGMVTVFCHKLGWVNLEMMLSQFHNRLTFGIERELCDLVRISALNGFRARLLYNAGYHTVAAVASASPVEVERHLRNATPFQSKKRSEWESERDLQRRMHAKCVWVDGRRAVTEADAAREIVGEACQIRKHDALKLGMEWKADAKVSSGNVLPDSITVPRGSSDKTDDTSKVSAQPLQDASKASGTGTAITEDSSNKQQTLPCMSSRTTSKIPQTSSAVTCGQSSITSTGSDTMHITSKTTAEAATTSRECSTVNKTAPTTQDKSRTVSNSTSSIPSKTTTKAPATLRECPTVNKTAPTTQDKSRTVSNSTSSIPSKTTTKAPATSRECPTVNKTAPTTQDKSRTVSNSTCTPSKTTTKAPTTSRECPTVNKTAPTTQDKSRTVSNSTRSTPSKTTTKAPTTSRECPTVNKTAPTIQDKSRTVSNSIGSTPCTSKLVSDADTFTNSSWLNSTHSPRPNKSSASTSIPRNTERCFLTPSRTETISRKKERSDIPGSSPQEIYESKAPLRSLRQGAPTISTTARDAMLPGNVGDPSLVPATRETVDVRRTVGDSEDDSRSLKRSHSVNGISVECSSPKRNLMDLKETTGSSKDPRGTTDVLPDVVNSLKEDLIHSYPAHAMSPDKDKTTPCVPRTGCISPGQRITGGQTDPGENTPRSASKVDTGCCQNNWQMYEGNDKTPETKKSFATTLDESPELIAVRESPDNNDDSEDVAHRTSLGEASAAFSPELYSEALFPEHESPVRINNSCCHQDVIMSESIGFEMMATSVEQSLQTENLKDAHPVSRKAFQTEETEKGLAVPNQESEGTNNPGRSEPQGCDKQDDDIAKATAMCTPGMFDSVIYHSQTYQGASNGTRSPDNLAILDRSTSDQSRRGSASSFCLKLSQSFEEPSDSDLSTRTLAAVAALEENQRELKDVVCEEGHQGTQGFQVDSDISNETVAAIEAMENEVVEGREGTDVIHADGSPWCCTAVKDRSFGFLCKSVATENTLENKSSPVQDTMATNLVPGLDTKSHNSPSAYTTSRSQFPRSVTKRARRGHPANDDSFSFTIIDVTEDTRLFNTFLEECQTKSFSFSVALEKLPAQTSTIGGKFRKGAVSCPSNKELPFAIEDERVAVVGLSLCWEDRDAYFVSLKESDETPIGGRRAHDTPRVTAGLTLRERLDGLRALLGLQRKQQSKTAFGIKDQYKVLSRACGLVIKGELQDPKVATWLLDPGAKERNFHHLVEHFLPQETDLLQGIDGSFGVGGLGVAAQSAISARLRSSVEVVLTMKLMEHIKPMLKAEGLLHAFTKVEMPVASCLARMELNGLGFSNDECENIKHVLKAKLRSLEQDAYRMANHTFCLASPEEVSRVLFLELKLPPDGSSASSTSPGQPCSVKPSRGGSRRKVKYFGTSKDVLEKLLSLHPLPKVILEWRRVNSALTKVVFPVQREQSRCEAPLNMSRIHSIALTHTATGRVTFVEPNLQNVPKDFDINLPTVISDTPPESTHPPAGRKSRKRARNTAVFVPGGDVASSSPGPQFSVSMRSAFVPFSNALFVGADYSQLELRLIAHMSGDAKLTGFLNAGGDVFKMIGGEMFRIAQESVSDEQRQRAKQVCYGIIYGIGAKALGLQLGVSEEEAAIFVDSFKARFIGVRSYLKKTVDECRKMGYVTTVSGRKRYLPNIRACNAAAKSHAERQAVNTTIQGSAADLVKIAMVNIDRRLCDEFPICWRTHRQRADDGLGGKSTHVGTTSRHEWNFRGAFLVLQLHDELLFEVAEDDLQRVISIVKDEMENAMKLSVKIPVKVQTGKSWGTLEPMEVFGP